MPRPVGSLQKPWVVAAWARAPSARRAAPARLHGPVPLLEAVGARARRPVARFCAVVQCLLPRPRARHAGGRPRARTRRRRVRALPPSLSRSHDRPRPARRPSPRLPRDAPRRLPRSPDAPLAVARRAPPRPRRRDARRRPRRDGRRPRAARLPRKDGHGPGARRPAARDLGLGARGLGRGREPRARAPARRHRRDGGRGSRRGAGESRARRDDLRPRRRLARPPRSSSRPRPAPGGTPSCRRDRLERRRRTRPDPPSAPRRRVAGSRRDRRRRARSRDRPGPPPSRRRTVRARPVRRGNPGDLGESRLSRRRPHHDAPRVGRRHPARRAARRLTRAARRARSGGASLPSRRAAPRPRPPLRLHPLRRLRGARPPRHVGDAATGRDSRVRQGRARAGAPQRSRLEPRPLHLRAARPIPVHRALRRNAALVARGLGTRTARGSSLPAPRGRRRRPVGTPSPGGRPPFRLRRAGHRAAHARRFGRAEDARDDGRALGRPPLRRPAPRARAVSRVGCASFASRRVPADPRGGSSPGVAGAATGWGSVSRSHRDRLRA